MSKRIVSFALSGFLIIVLLNWSCTKIDTTTIGSDLIPPVDNVSTFADTFAINTLQGVFYDTTKLSVSNTAENYVIGKISSDPVMGETNARLFLQLKPGFYPYYMGSPNDTIIAPDSVVLCFAYKAAYGDTNSTMTFLVNAVAPTPPNDPWDSLGTTDKPILRDINYAPQLGAAVSDPTTIDFHSLSSYRVIGKGKDSVINQVRIKLSTAFRDALFLQDSVYSTTFNNHNGFSRDTFFRAFNNGLAITMTQGNVLLYTQLADPSTRLEMHYKFRHGIVDTGMSVFTFNNGSGGTAAPRRSSVADNIVRTRNPLPNPGDQEIYLQTAPGTYASLKIPQLTGYTNRIIHRAEITLEQIPTDISDSYFKAPDYLYVDLVDSGTAKWKPIYNDLNPSYPYDPDYKSGLPYFPSNNQVDFSYFGGTPKQKSDPASPTGERSYYTINITRYVQQIVTKQTPNYELRLFAPYNLIYPQYSDVAIAYPNLLAAGRVRLGGGNAIDPKYRMRLRIIYSNIK